MFESSKMDQNTNLFASLKKIVFLSPKAVQLKCHRQN